MTSSLEQQFAINNRLISTHKTIIDARILKIRKLYSKFSGVYGRILDVGCGDGVILEPFTKADRIDGVEAFEPFRKQCLDRGFLRVFDWDIGSHTWPLDQWYNVVVSGETSEHLCDVDLFLSNVNKALIPGGYFIYTFPNIRTLVGLAMMLFQNRPPMGSARYRSPHFKDFTTTTAKMALRNNGFKILRVIGSSFVTPWGNDCLPRLADFFPSWSTQVIVLARKVCEATYDPDEVGKFEIWKRISG